MPPGFIPRPRAAPRDLRDLLTLLRKREWLTTITQKVDPELEIAALQELSVKAGGPALLFDNVLGSPFRVLANVFGTRERAIECLGGTAPADRLAEMVSLAKVAAGDPRDAFVTLTRQAPRFLREGMSVLPKVVGSGPCQEQTLPDASKLPIQTSWPGDGGPFLTLPLVFTRDPATHDRNVGVYRMQRFTPSKFGMHFQLHKGGRAHLGNLRSASTPKDSQSDELEVAVALGGPPSLTFSAVSALPENIDEVMIAAWLGRNRIPLVRCQTVDLEVPATAEFILEGTVSMEERREEGPFGDHFGLYDPVDEYPVFRLKRLTHRKDAIYPTTTVGRPPMEDAVLGELVADMSVPFLGFLSPEITDLSIPAEGCFHALGIVSISGRYPHHATKVMHGLWGFSQLSFLKAILVTCRDVDIRDEVQVASVMVRNVDPLKDMMLIEHQVADSLDPVNPVKNVGSKVGIDATMSPCGGWNMGRGEPGSSNPLPDGKETGRLLRKAVKGGVIGAFHETVPGFTFVQLENDEEDSCLRTTSELLEMDTDHHLRFTVLLDKNAHMSDPWDRLWRTLVFFDPARDISLHTAFDGGVTLGGSGGRRTGGSRGAGREETSPTRVETRVVIDSTSKVHWPPGGWPEEVRASPETLMKLKARRAELGDLGFDWDTLDV